MKTYEELKKDYEDMLERLSKIEEVQKRQEKRINNLMFQKYYGKKF